MYFIPCMNISGEYITLNLLQYFKLPKERKTAKDIRAIVIYLSLSILPSALWWPHHSRVLRVQVVADVDSLKAIKCKYHS